LPEHEQILIIVDQFEELFRFASVSGRTRNASDAAMFVKLLLEATNQRELPIYIVLGLRSDYMGDCAQFRDLPEAVTSALYLIPRMTRGQQREAIEGPVRVGGGTITPRLVNRLLNDVGDNPDQLPILQHALMRTWAYWTSCREERPIDLDDYNAIGGMADALSIHANDSDAELPDDRSREIAHLAFQCLTGRDINSRESRRPTTIAAMAAVANVDADAMIRIIDHFRRPERAFLTPPWGVEIDPASVIDISHESLIRCWDRLKTWAKDEADAAEGYRRLAQAASLHAQGKQGLWRDPELQLALHWRETRKPNAAWAERYDPGFTQAMEFLDSSRDARDALRRSQERGRRLRLAAVVAVAAILASLLGWTELDTMNAFWREITVIDAAKRQRFRPYVLAETAERALKPGVTFRECLADCPEMVVIPAGEFMMGAPVSERGHQAWEEPVHKVTIGKPFAVSKFELTFDDWDACVAYGDCDPNIIDGGFSRGRQPVIEVTWNDAQRYVAWLSKMTGKSYRLLSEAEYEYAARAGKETAYPWGEDVGKNNADCGGCGSEWDGKQPAPVGSFAANQFGLYDMVGNVWQWVEDCMHYQYAGAPADGSAWVQGGDCNYRIMRGGGFGSGPQLIRSASRMGTPVGNRATTLGFRVARVLLP
jgi:formylglycine-generating enzyme required for sulfatase activity